MRQKIIPALQTYLIILECGAFISSIGLYSARPIELEPGTFASQNAARALAILLFPFLRSWASDEVWIQAQKPDLIVPLDLFSTLSIKRCAQFAPGGTSRQN
jgi:hypothetical protein